LLLCTVHGCRQSLVRTERRLACSNGHSFDVARSGYVNLLQPQDRRSRSPGDAREAVAARRRFLDQGYEEPLVRAIVGALPLGARDALLDVGCGEGHHLGAFRRAYGIDGHGVDISVAAIELAARRHQDCTWVVANADRFLPWADGSFRAVAAITSRLPRSELHRVLARDGRLLVVVPADDDLVELREAVLGAVVELGRAERAIERLAPQFAVERRERVACVARLDREALADAMASSYRGARTRERARLGRLSAMAVTLAREVMVLRPLRRRSPP
jgi:23S rRNA (guanine745-N1)-methyltransferase